MSESEDSEYNEEMEHEELNALRDAYECYQRLKKEAEDANSDYFSIISRNIYEKIDVVDKELLEDLDLLLHVSDREEIISKVLAALESRDDLMIEDSLFRRKSSLRRSNTIENGSS